MSDEAARARLWPADYILWPLDDLIEPPYYYAIANCMCISHVRVLPESRSAGVTQWLQKREKMRELTVLLILALARSSLGHTYYSPLDFLRHERAAVKLGTQ